MFRCLFRPKNEEENVRSSDSRDSGGIELTKFSFEIVMLMMAAMIKPTLQLQPVNQRRH